MLYLLDTDTCIYSLNRAPGYERILARLDRLQYGDALISAVSLGEIEVGLAKRARPDRNRRLAEQFLARFEIAPFDEAAARIYGDLRAALERRGRPIGPLDTLIAAQAVSLKAALVTNNTREFSRITGLRLQNWIKE